MDDLSQALRRERELLEDLRFRFVEVRLLLAAGELRYVERATEEVHAARSRAREADLLRAAQVQRLGELHRGPAAPTLRELASRAPQPWSCILRDHHDGLCAIVSEVEVVGHRNAELARAGLHDLAARTGPSLFDGFLQATGVGAATAPVPTVTLTVDRGADEEAGHLADEQAFQDVVTTASRLRMPALLAFLR